VPVDGAGGMLEAETKRSAREGRESAEGRLELSEARLVRFQIGHFGFLLFR